MLSPVSLIGEVGFIVGAERWGLVKVEHGSTSDFSPGKAPVKPGYEPIETVTDDQVRQLREWRRREQARQQADRQALMKRVQNELHAGRVEARFVAAVAKDPSGERFAECREIPPEIFSDVDCSRAWLALKTAPTFEAGCANAAVLKFFSHDTIGEEYHNDRQSMFLGWLAQRGLENIDEWRAKLPTATSKTKLQARLDARLFNLEAPPPNPLPRYLVAGVGISTPGNLTCVSSQAKNGKSSLIAAMMAAAICAEFNDSGRDTLGVTATAPGGLTILQIDTEQSPFDAHQMIRRTLRRAGVETSPPFLKPYSLAGFSASETRSAISLLIAAEAVGGLHSVIIDGVADAVNDVNDAAECNAFVAELHDLAIKYNCPIIGVIHENPGQDGGKMRGHLGSQLVRKAESIIRLKKTDEVTVVFSDKTRQAPILEKNGPRFQWSNEAQMHVSVANSGTLRDADSVADLRDLADEVFEGQRLRYAEACQKIEKARRVGEKAGEKWFTRMKKAEVIHNAGMGYWEKKAA